MAGLASRLGRKVVAGSRSNSARNTVMAGAVGVAGVTGMASGLSGFNDALYSYTTGNPNIDQEVLGTDLSFRSLVAPLPGEFTKPRMLAGGLGPDIFYQWQSGLINRRTMRDYNTRVYQGFRSPEVDGSIVFGQYNSRFG